MKRMTSKLTRAFEMQFENFVSGRRLFRIALAAMMAIAFAGVAGAQEGRTGKVQQGLVGGSIVTPEAQERNGLLTLDTGCSASLLRNNWVITAAHCVDNPNPMAPGQFILNPENSVTLTANWNTVQQRQSVRIISFRPLDLAIIRVANPFIVGGSTANYNREAFREGELMSLPIIALGRGVNRFAEGSGSSAIPSQTDGMFRVGVFNISSVADNKYRFPSTAGQSMSGGDSGGPSYATVGDRLLLVGVHTGCQQECAGGKTCGNWPGPGPAPADYSNWQWVTATPSCSDTSIASIWDEIDRYLGAFTPTPKPVASRNSCASSLIKQTASVSWAWNDGSGQTSIAVFPSDRAKFLRRTAWSIREGGWGDDVKWFAGDFNRDGRTDIGAAWNNGGSTTLTVRQSTGSRFTAAHWAVNAGGWSDTAVWLPGDFNNDGRTDVAGVWNDGGQTSIAVYLSDATKFLNPTQWSLRDGGWGATVKWFAGDFNGDGRTDIGAAWNNNGATTLTVRESTGSGFRLVHWAPSAGNWSDSSVFVAGDFNADGRTDVARLWNDLGRNSMAVSLSDGVRFQGPSDWSIRDGGWIEGKAVKWTAGDFNGDGRTDIAAAWNDDNLNTLTVRQSTGSGFRAVHWAVKQGGWRDTAAWCAGQFNTIDLTLEARPVDGTRSRFPNVLEKAIDVNPQQQPLKPDPPICASARSARARNSPAAPGLEARCRAAGGLL